MKKTSFLMCVLAFAMSLTGCGNPGIVQVSPDTYLLARDDHAGIFGNRHKLRAGVIRDANAFAAKQGKIAIPISSREHPVGVMGDWASFEYQFRVVDKKDPEARRTALVPPSQADVNKPVEKIDENVVPDYAIGSGFFVTEDGYFVTNHHVIASGTRITVKTGGGEFPAKIVRADASNDLAILKVQGQFSALQVRGSRDLKIADRVSTVGFPNPVMQGLAAKYGSGEVSALSGPGDDPRFLQISVPVQPGNSGGPLVDTAGRVVGVVVGQLNKIQTLKVTGHLPENVNYAIKGTILLAVLEALPGLNDKLKPASESAPKEQSEVAKFVEQATGLVVVERSEK